MNESAAHEKSFAFSIRIVSLCRHLRKQRCEQALIQQILRSAAAADAVRKPDRVSPVHFALKECSETWYWLRLLHATSCLTDQQFESLKQDCLELMRLLTATTKTLAGQNL